MVSASDTSFDQVMNYRTEVITGGCTSKNEYVIIYNTLRKLENKWPDNYWLMVKCSKMLSEASSQGVALDLSQVCSWMSKNVGVVLNVYEVRSLMRYVHTAMADEENRSQGYCELYPPSKRGYDGWCSHFLQQAHQKALTTKEKQSRAFHEELEKQVVHNNPAEFQPKKKMMMMMKKKKKPSSLFYGQEMKQVAVILPRISQERLPRTSVEKNSQTKRTGHSKHEVAGKRSGLNGGDPFTPAPFNSFNSRNHHLDNLTDAVVDTQVKKHARKYLISDLPALARPGDKSGGEIDYTIAVYSTNTHGSCDGRSGSNNQEFSCVKHPSKRSVSRAVGLHARMDKEFFGEVAPERQVVDQHGLLQEESFVSKMIKEKQRQRFKKEGLKLKEEVFAALGL